MKNLGIYFVAVAATVLTVACEKTEMDGYAANEGGVVMSLAQTRAGETSDWTPNPTWEGCTTFIYQNGTDAETSEPTKTLIRKYAPGDCPTTIKLLVGSYTAKVQWGERPESAAVDKCFYEGSADFTIEAGQTQSVAVSCQPQSTAVKVVFDATVSPEPTGDGSDSPVLTNCTAKIALPDDNNSNTVDALTFTKNGTGYFTMPEGVSTLTWTFEATHVDQSKGTVSKSANIAVEAGKSYKLTFKYSPDLPGYISVGIKIVEPEEKNDVMVFSPDPDIISPIFESAEPQDFTQSGVALTMKANGGATVNEARIYLVEEEPAAVALAATRAIKEKCLWNWKPGVAEDPRVSVVSGDEGKTLTVTLQPAFFSFPIGNTKLRFEVLDSNNGSADKTATVRTNEGIHPVVPANDCDLWANSVTLHAVSSGSAPTFKLRQAGTTNWQTLTGELQKGNDYTATFAAEWTSSQNANNLNVYTPVEYTGVWANHTYEAAVVIDGHEYSTTFVTSGGDTIPNGNMENKSASCYTTNNSDPSTVIWGSGNNSMTSQLCQAATKPGMEGKNCSKLEAIVKFNNLAAGNLFLGTFTMVGTNGTVDFGIKYTYTARPKGLRFKYHANIGTVNYNMKNGPLANDGTTSDQACVYFTIMDWSARRGVTSGLGDPSGMWSADAQANLDGCGPILGYGMMVITGKTDGDSMVEGYIPVNFYDKAAAAPQGNYTLTIACSTSRYGDYMNGCSSNVLYVDDFEWVY